VLEFYKSQGSDSNHNGALSKIPKNLRMMYVHAYQSYIWNSAVSQRIRLLGCSKAVPGDLVLSENEGVANELGHEIAEDTPTTETAAAATGKTTQQTLMATSKTPKAKVLTEEDASRYTIYDVVLPLPGYSVTYPSGTIGELYRKMLDADGLDIDKMFRPQK
jgi:tRNA pseudouridine13 synthase